MHIWWAHSCLQVQAEESLHCYGDDNTRVVFDISNEFVLDLCQCGKKQSIFIEIQVLSIIKEKSSALLWVQFPKGLDVIFQTTNSVRSGYNSPN